MLAAASSWPDLQILETAIQMLQESSEAVQPDLDSLEYRTDEDLPDWMRGDE